MTLVHEVHSSELRGYRKCRQFWDWRYRDCWEPIKKPAPLEDGTVWHKALEILYNPDTWNRELGELHQLAHSALIAEANTQRQEYLTRAGKNQLDDDEAVEYGERLSLLRSMLVKACRSLDRETYRPIATEREFQCPIVDERGQQLTCYCPGCRKQYDDAVLHSPQDEWRHLTSGLPVVFNCRIDAIFEDKAELVYAVDHKSTGQLLKEDSVIPEMEDQLPSYLWCLRENGYRVHGMILNQFRKAYPKPPKRLERLQLGRMYSVNKMQLTDFDTARQVFMQYDARAYQHGLYNEYLDYLQITGPKFARQFVVFKTPIQLDYYGRNILKQARELIKGPEVYPNQNRMNCEQCIFQGPCFSLQSGEEYYDELDANFIKSEPYYIQRRRERVV